MQVLLLFIFAVVGLSMWQAGTGNPRHINRWFAALTLALTVGYTSFRLIG
jgi:hypothetical protein